MTLRFAWLLRAFVCAGLVLQLGGCALPAFLRFDGERVKWTQLTLSAAPDANQNSPVAVDLVLVTDEKLLARLSELTAAKWFEARADLLKTYPGELRHGSWEIVPGQVLKVPGQRFEGPRVMGVLAFANYAAPGAHRARVQTLQGSLVLRFDRGGFDVAAGTD